MSNPSTPRASSVLNNLLRSGGTPPTGRIYKSGQSPSPRWQRPRNSRLASSTAPPPQAKYKPWSRSTLLERLRTFVKAVNKWPVDFEIASPLTCVAQGYVFADGATTDAGGCPVCCEVCGAVAVIRAIPNAEAELQQKTIKHVLKERHTQRCPWKSTSADSQIKLYYSGQPKVMETDNPTQTKVNQDSWIALDPTSGLETSGSKVLELKGYGIWECSQCFMRFKVVLFDNMGRKREDLEQEIEHKKRTMHFDFCCCTTIHHHQDSKLS